MHIMFVNMYTNITVYLFVKNKAKETLKCILSGKKNQLFSLSGNYLGVKFCQDYVRLPL